jgi:hypothetical protein
MVVTARIVSNLERGKTGHVRCRISSKFAWLVSGMNPAYALVSVILAKSTWGQSSFPSAHCKSVYGAGCECV